MAVCSKCGNKVFTGKYLEIDDKITCFNCIPTGKKLSVDPNIVRSIDWIYDETYDLSKLTAKQKKDFKDHRIPATFPVAVSVILYFLTLGIFHLIYFGIKHGQLPKIKSNDFGTGKAIGFMFIPFFNFYWQFMFWVRLANRINLQHRLRGREPPIPKALIIVTLILGFIPVAAYATLVLAPIMIGFIQHGINTLVKEQE